jgi:hypothetical protein
MGLETAGSFKWDLCRADRNSTPNLECGFAADDAGDHVWCKWDHPPQGCKIDYCSHA